MNGPATAINIGICASKQLSVCGRGDISTKFSALDNEDIELSNVIDVDRNLRQPAVSNLRISKIQPFKLKNVDGEENARSA